MGLLVGVLAAAVVEQAMVRSPHPDSGPVTVVEREGTGGRPAPYAGFGPFPEPADGEGPFRNADALSWSAKGKDLFTVRGDGYRFSFRSRLAWAGGLQAPGAGALLTLQDLASRFAPVEPRATTGRWVLFAAASGQSLDLGVPSAFGPGALRGLTRERTAFVGDSQAGLAWKKGPVQAGLSYSRRSIAVRGVRGAGASQEESVVGVRFSVTPR